MTLFELVNKAILDDDINAVIEGYTLLHKILMAYRDTNDVTEKQQYLELLERVLSQAGCNPNIYNKHGVTPLQQAVSDQQTPSRKSECDFQILRKNTVRTLTSQ